MDKNVRYTGNEMDPLTYSGPIKNMDMAKVFSFCYFDETIFVLFKTRERGTRYLRKFDSNFDRKMEIKEDLRLKDQLMDDIMLEDEAFMSDTKQYLILSYIDRVEFLMKNDDKYAHLDVFKTV